MITATTDPLRLRAVFEALTELVDDLDPDRITVTDLRDLLLNRRQSVQDRMDEVMGRSSDRRPVVLDPTALHGHMSRQGQPLTPVITAGAAPTHGLSSAEVWMPPYHTSFAHVHRYTGVSVLVLQGSAITLWWDEDGGMHELPQVAGQHLYIPHGVPHAAINPHNVPVVAAEFRSNPVFNADNELLPDLDPLVTARISTVRAAA
jgi:uncharacterized RmlC-like cupin family protein